MSRGIVDKNFFSPAKKDNTFLDKSKCHLILDIEEFRQIVKSNKGKLMSFDTETKGLDFSIPKPIVGFSFAFDAFEGYYVPVRHIVGTNISNYEDQTDIIIEEFNKTNVNKKTIDRNHLSSNGIDHLFLVEWLSDYGYENYIESFNDTFYTIKVPVYCIVGTNISDYEDQTNDIIAEFNKTNINKKIIDRNNLVPNSIDHQLLVEWLSDHAHSDYIESFINNYYTIKLPTLRNKEKEVFDLLFELLSNNKILMYNAVFDLKMVMAEGYDVYNLKIFDVMVLTYNADTEELNKSLKNMALHFLGRQVPTFMDTVGKNMSFANITPSRGYKYAVYDVLNTYGLYAVLFPVLSKECMQILKIDNGLIIPMTYYMSQDIYIDRGYVRKYKESLKKEALSYLKDITTYFDEPINPASSQQLSESLGNLGINTNETTESGLMKCDKNALSKIQSEHPVVENIIKFKQASKQINGYIENLESVDRGKVSFKLFNTATGRLASGGNNPYFLPINFQNLTKPKSAMYCVYEAKDGEEDTFQIDDNRGIYIVKGWKFRKVDSQFMQDYPNLTYVEGLTNVNNIRKAIVVPDYKKYYFVSLDYSQQELRLIGGFSKDKIYMDTFTSENGDLHESMGKSVFGEERYNSSPSFYRKIAKYINFGLNYGGNEFTLARLLEKEGISMSECEKIYESYMEATKSGLQRWKSMEVKKAKANKGVIYSSFGRPRRLGKYLFSNDRSLVSFGERSVPSHLIQGSAGDLMRVVLKEIYHNVILKYGKHVQLVGTIHDEVNFYISKEMFDIIISDILQIMDKKIDGCSLSIPVGVELGYSLGEQFEFKFKDGKWSPAV